MNCTTAWGNLQNRKLGIVLMLDVRYRIFTVEKVEKVLKIKLLNIPPSNSSDWFIFCSGTILSLQGNKIWFHDSLKSSGRGEYSLLLSSISVINDLKINGIFLAQLGSEKITRRTFTVFSGELDSYSPSIDTLGMVRQKHRETSGLPAKWFISRPSRWLETHHIKVGQVTLLSSIPIKYTLYP